MKTTIDIGSGSINNVLEDVPLVVHEQVDGFILTYHFHWRQPIRKKPLLI
jgi:hypothetical protein